jgi:transcriptional regulator with XRE-family HTH domain
MLTLDRLQDSTCIARNFYRARQHAGMSLRAAADAIGVSHEAIRMYEGAAMCPPPDTLDRMAQAYGFSVEVLVDGIVRRRLEAPGSASRIAPDSNERSAFLDVWDFVAIAALRGLQYCASWQIASSIRDFCSIYHEPLVHVDYGKYLSPCLVLQHWPAASAHVLGYFDDQRVTPDIFLTAYQLQQWPPVFPSRFWQDQAWLYIRIRLNYSNQKAALHAGVNIRTWMALQYPWMARPFRSNVSKIERNLGIPVGRIAGLPTTADLQQRGEVFGYHG